MRHIEKTQHWITQKTNSKISLWLIVPSLISIVLTPIPSLTKTVNLSATTSESYTTSLSISEPINHQSRPQQRSHKTSQQSSPNSNSPAQEAETEPLDFSDTGRSGQQTAGEGRGLLWENTDFPLTALVPSSNWGKTTQEHPTFWFYVPTYAEPVSHIEFVLQNRDRHHLWRQQLSPHNASGYLNITLPPEQPGLETDRWYRWYLKVYRDDKKRYPPVVVYGWVNKVKLDASLSSQLNNSDQKPYEVYGKSGIWFDALDSLLKWHHLNAFGSEFSRDWQQLIEAQGVDLNLPQPNSSDLAERLNSP
ncbi:MAG TPA: DUF928 domain-containing protein [Xenococcaceae cyanobacterium]|jgi:hypothetical protein